VLAARSRSARKGLILKGFATLRVAKKKCFSFDIANLNKKIESVALNDLKQK